MNTLTFAAFSPSQGPENLAKIEYITQLPRDMKIQEAVKRLINNESVLFSPFISNNAFPLDILASVVLELTTPKQRNENDKNETSYEFTEEKDIDDGSSLYGPVATGFLNYVRITVTAKKIKQAFDNQKETEIL